MFKKVESIFELKNICQLHKRNKHFLLSFGYIFHRNLSIYITRFLLIFFPRLSPNTVSFLMIVISLIGCIFLFISNSLLNFLGLIFIYFGFLLDKVDGELARYKNEYSIQGIYLDELYHFLIPVFILLSFFWKSLENKYAIIFLLIAIIFLFEIMKKKLEEIDFVEFENKINEFFIYKILSL